MFSLVRADTSSYEIGKPVTPYDRGNSQQDVLESYRLARDEVFNTYFEGCGAPKSIGTCIYVDMGKIISTFFDQGWSIEPQWEYYIPVSVTETAEKPFATAFYTKQEINTILPITEKALYPSSSTMITGGIQSEANARTAPHNFSIDTASIDQAYQEIIGKFSAFQRFRNPNQHSDGYRHMNAHVIGLDFEALLRDHVLFNSVDAPDAGYEGGGGDPLRPLTWAHNHAKYGIKDSSPFPATQLGEKMMFEEPLVVNFAMYAFPVRQLYNAEMYPSSQKEGCWKRKTDIYKFVLSGGTVADYNKLRNGFVSPDKIYTMDDNDSKCLPGALGEKFAGPLSIMKTAYAIDAGNIGNYRGLRTARIIGNQKYKDVAFYELTEQSAGIRKRDKIQYLGQRMDGANYRGRIGKKYPGCQNWDLNTHFIPAYLNEDQYLFGPAWDDLNHNYDAEGERFLAVHWRYLTGCRKPRPGEVLINRDDSKYLVE